MAVSAQSAARYLGELSDWQCTNLMMQKMLYMAHMYHLGTNNTPLVSGQFEAWDYGPVHAELYFAARIFGASPVKNIFHGAAAMVDEAEKHSIREAYRNLRQFTAGQLVDITHRKDGAWYKNYVPGGRRLPISNDDILAEYQERVQ